MTQMLHPPASHHDDGNLAELFDYWRTLCRHMADPDFELTVEEFAPLAVTFRQLLAVGVAFDPALVALMDVLERQTLASDEEGDHDDADALLDLNDEE